MPLLKMATGCRMNSKILFKSLSRIPKKKIKYSGIVKKSSFDLIRIAVKNVQTNT